MGNLQGPRVATWHASMSGIPCAHEHDVSLNSKKDKGRRDKEEKVKELWKS